MLRLETRRPTSYLLCSPGRRPAEAVIRPPARYPSRTSLAWGLLFFVLGQLALLAVMEQWQPGLRDPVYGAKRDLLRAAQAREPDRPLFVLLGSSRTAVGARPEVIRRGLGPGAPLVFNMAQMGADPVVELIWLRRLLRDGLRPRWVGIEVLPPVLHQEDDRFFEIGHLDHLGWHDLRVAQPFATDPRHRALQWVWNQRLPWATQRFYLLCQLAPTWVPFHPRMNDWRLLDASGWLPVRPDSVSPHERERYLELTRREYEYWFKNYSISDSCNRAMHELLDVCRRERIDVFLYLMPEAKSFQGWYPAAARAEVEHYLSRLSREYQVPVVDARDWSADEEFKDGHHLLPAGAAAFSERFGREILAPFLAGKPCRTDQ